MNSHFMAGLDFSGRRVVVTGGAGGIGLAAARLFLAHGAAVTVADRDRDALDRLERDLGNRPTIDLFEADVAEESDVENLFGKRAAGPEPIGVLVNNVGIGARKPTTELDTDDWSRVMEVNMTSAFLCSRELARRASPEWDSAIVNVASIMGLVGNDLYPNMAYHASKGALVNMTRALAVEWAPLGIRVNAVAPTFVETALTRKLLAEPGAREGIVRKTPLGRLAEPEEIANGIVFLASAAAGLITGTVLPIDGGWLAL